MATESKWNFLIPDLLVLWQNDKSPKSLSDTLFEKHKEYIFTQRHLTPNSEAIRHFVKDYIKKEGLSRDSSIKTPITADGLTNKESLFWQEKRLCDNKLYKVLIFSDPHGWLADLTALRCINKILQSEHFDEVCINGDIVDMPYISRHTSRLYEDGILSGYSEVQEISYTKEQILNPLRLSFDGKIRVRLGNHDERITNPMNFTQSQMAKLAVLFKHYNTSDFDSMLGITEADNYIYDTSTVHTYFDMFDVVHGLSLNKNAAEKNIMEYMGSGTSAHTHRLNSKYLTNRKKPYVWFESGCTRVKEEVEYLPTGKIADWQQGFVTVVFHKDGDNVRFYGHPTLILDGRCYYNGIIYDGNYK